MKTEQPASHLVAIEVVGRKIKVPLEIPKGHKAFMYLVVSKGLTKRDQGVSMQSGVIASESTETAEAFLRAERPNRDISKLQVEEQKGNVSKNLEQLSMKRTKESIATFRYGGEEYFTLEGVVESVPYYCIAKYYKGTFQGIVYILRSELSEHVDAYYAKRTLDNKVTAIANMIRIFRHFDELHESPFSISTPILERAVNNQPA